MKEFSIIDILLKKYNFNYFPISLNFPFFQRMYILETLTKIIKPQKQSFKNQTVISLVTVNSIASLILRLIYSGSACPHKIKIIVFAYDNLLSNAISFITKEKNKILIKHKEAFQLDTQMLPIKSGRKQGEK